MIKNNYKEHTRNCIINSTKKQFAEQGYQKPTSVEPEKDEWCIVGSSRV